MPSIGAVLSHDHGRPRENSCKGELYIFRARTATFEVIEHARQMIACMYGAGPCAGLYSATVFCAIGAALEPRFIHRARSREVLEHVIAWGAPGLPREPDAAPSPVAAERAMKVAILAGGAGSRLSEETVLKPKPMVEIGGRPILWHIMMHYSHRLPRVRDRARLQGRVHQEVHSRLLSFESDFKVDLAQGGKAPPYPRHNWKIDLVDTGQQIDGRADETAAAVPRRGHVHVDLG